MEVLSLGLALFFPILLGWILIDCLTNFTARFYFLEKVFLSFGLGFGVITLTMFYFSWSKINYSPIKVVFSLFIPAIFLSIIIKMKAFKNVLENRFHCLPSSSNSRKAWEIGLIVLLILNAYWIFVRTYLVEIDMWDSWAVWAFKAKIYFVHKIIPFEKFSEFSKVWGNWDYPHHVPLMETWVLLWLGYWNDQLPRMIFPIFWMGIIINSYYYLLHHGRREMALIGAMLIATFTGMQIWTISTIAEPVFLFYYLTSFYLLLRWNKEQHNISLILSSIFIGLAAWTKQEGLVFFIFNLIILSLMILFSKDRFRKISKIITYISIFFLIISGWIYLKHQLNLKSIHVNATTISISFLISNIYKIKTFFYYLWRHLNNWGYFNVLWYFFFVMLLIKRKFILRFPYFYFLIAIGLGFSLTFLFSIISDDQYFRDAFVRLLLAPAILSIVFIVMIQQENEDHALK